jgi:hypothetical protein
VTRPRWILSAVLLLAAAFIFAATPPQLWADDDDDDGGNASNRSAKAQIHFEMNATANDLAIRVDLDGQAWKTVAIAGPSGSKILEASGKVSSGTLGVTGLSLETNEPSQVVAPADLLAQFPAGKYTFKGTTLGGQKLTGTVMLTHDIPDGPKVLSPSGGAVVKRANTVITWQAVTTPAGIQIVGYEVFVTGGIPARSFNVRLGAGTTSVTVPAQFLLPNTAYQCEVVAIEASGNQTFTTNSFRTAKEESEEKEEDDD